MTDLDALREALEIPMHFEGSGHGSDEWWAARRLERDAARALVLIVEGLRLKENGEKVWWCEEHEVSAMPRGDICWVGGLADCRMVEKVLVDP